MNLKSSLNLLSENAIQKSQTKKLKTINQLLIDHPDSVIFHHPVNWQQLELLDYPQFIKHPMDLETVQNKLDNEEYRFVEEAIDDLQLIWDNCRMYNETNQVFCGIADKMEKYFKKLVKNYFTSIIFNQKQGATKNQNKMKKVVEPIYKEPIDIRIKCIETLKTLTPDQFGQIIQVILENDQKVIKIDDDYCKFYVQKMEEWLIDVVNEKLEEIGGKSLLLY